IPNFLSHMSENKNKAAAEGGQAAAVSEAPTTRKYLVPGYSVDMSGFYGGWGAAYATREVLVKDVMQSVKDRALVVLNAVVPREGLMFITRIDTDVAIELLKDAPLIKSFIGHEATAKLLSELAGREVQFNRGIYQPKPGDVALVVRLRTRPSSDVKDVAPDDLEFSIVWYLE
ncbi:STIV orfB116 family protein, partial [Pyrobaculum sp.]|uniref:STIV orfB116 family protein n=1 Tax=Pyrobaculum sp. TaxID=2004705 RepID=UPI003D0CAC8C